MISALLLLGTQLKAQADSTQKGWHLHTLGVSMTDGNVQFFEGYNYLVLYADATSGLPIYPDWNVYSGLTILPRFYQFGANVAWVDTVRGLKLRLGGSYAYRADSMQFVGGFAVNDTVFGRNASEKGHFFGFNFSGMKQTRKILKFMRLYGGAEVEFLISPSSEISFLEYSFDVGDQEFIELNTFSASGKPRFNVFASALLGMETVFAKHFGFTVEVKSGLGAQLVVRETAFGLAKTTWHLGLNYYLFDYKRRPLPKPEPIPDTYNGEPPLPEF